MSAIDNNLADILNAVIDPVIIVDNNLDVSFANFAAHALFGDDIVGRNLTLAVRHPDVLAAARQAVRKGVETYASFDLNDPTARSFDAICRPLSPGNDAVAAVMRETTMAKEAAKMRSEFVANVSHELRSPLASLMGFVETLQGPASEDAEARKRFLGIMADEAGRMARLIDDLLSLSKVQANEAIQPENRIDIQALVTSVVDGLQMRAKDRSMTIDVISKSTRPQVLGEEDEIIQVFENLIENALKYGQSGSGVEVTLAEVDRIPDIGGPGVAVGVRDHGEGIAPEHLPRLTERFYRIDKGRSRMLGGTGLGLAIVKHIVNRHRGRLTIESRLGEGSLFKVYLPSAS